MRSRALAFGCLLIGGALALVGSAQPWWHATGEGVVLKFSGTQATGGLSQALAIVALAGTLLMLALRPRGRRVVGTLLLLVGVGLAVVGGLGLQPSADAVGSEVHGVSLANTFQLSATVWPWLFAVSGALVAIGAVLTMITAGSWPARSNRFQSGQSRAEVPVTEDPAALWKAMDAGADPTTDASVGNRAPPHGGGVRGGVLPPRATTTAADSPRDARATGNTDTRAARNTDASGDARAAGNTDDQDTAKVPYPDVHNRDPGDTMDDTGGRRGPQEREE
jgi:uncharacterized membrane protein (TIGR02234 family)